jgi:tripartite-type tricarboxylate transporter receptor subunit TctC
MSITREVVCALAGGMLVLGAGAACGQTKASGAAQPYPGKAVRIVTNTPGGSTDLASRLIAQGISGALGQPVIIENRPAIVLVEIVSKAQPDGYTVLVESGTLWIAPFLQKVPYDPVKDFIPITLLTRAPNLLVVHPSIAAHTVKELIALAKAKPGALNYASSTAGSSNHLAGEMFNGMAGVKIVRVPYNGTGPALNGVIGGDVQMLFANAAAGMPHVKSGRLRALAVASLQPSPLAPGLPTVAAAGLPGFVAVTTNGMWAPANTPAPVIRRLNQEVVRFLNSTEAKEKFLNSGFETVADSPEEATTEIKADMARMSKVIKDAGIKGE